MGELALIFIIIIALAVIGLSLLFGARSDLAFRITAILLFAYVTILMIMHVSALPENYTVRIFIAYVVSAVAMVGLVFIDKKPFVTKLTLTFALIAHILGIFLI